MVDTWHGDQSVGAGTEDSDATREVSTPVPPIPPPPPSGGSDWNPPAPAAPKTRSVGFLIAGIVMAVAAIVLLAIGIVGFVAAGSAGDDEQAFAAERSELESTQDDLEQEQADVEEQADDLRANVMALDTELTALVDTGNEFVAARGRLTDVYNAAVDKVNAGDLAGGRAMFENEGGQALTEMEAALITQQEASAAFQAAFVALGEALP